MVAKATAGMIGVGISQQDPSAVGALSPLACISNQAKRQQERQGFCRYYLLIYLSVCLFIIVIIFSETSLTVWFPIASLEVFM